MDSFQCVNCVYGEMGVVVMVVVTSLEGEGRKVESD